MEKLAKQSFNELFLQYEDSSPIKGSKIRALIMRVESSNSSNDSDRQVQLKGITSADAVQTSKQYKIAMGYAEDGYINEITIEEV